MWPRLDGVLPIKTELRVYKQLDRELLVRVGPTMILLRARRILVLMDVFV